jgi:hypothetical protein
MIKAAYHYASAARLGLAALALAALAGCSTMQATRNGYLSDYSKIVLTENGGRGEFRAAAPIDPARSRVTEVAWKVQGDLGLSAEEQAQLVTMYRDELTAALAKLPPRPEGRPAEVRTAITVVKTVSPVLNVATTLLVFIPVDEGGAAVEIEAVDAQNKQQLAALVQGYHAPMTEFAARFQTLAPAELALKKAANDFALLVQAAPK